MLNKLVKSKPAAFKKVLMTFMVLLTHGHCNLEDARLESRGVFPVMSAWSDGALVRLSSPYASPVNASCLWSSEK